jgi:hypothetical protein
MENEAEKIPALKEGEVKKLQTRISFFEELRMGNYIYVDKTKYIFEMANTQESYFLSRPRRFGKSLILSTLQALFENKKYLFEGLYIYDKWEWGTAYPIIKIDFSDLKVNTPEILTNDLINKLKKIAQEYSDSIDLGGASLPRRFSNLIESLYKRKKQKVVILIDEYDKAIRSNLDKPEKEREAIKEVLRDFYEVIKANDAYIRFVFLTGLLEINGLSIFSGLNNVTNITLVPEFSGICGYTQQELENNFDYYICEMATSVGCGKKETLAKIKNWYDGYSWDGKIEIYNPYSLLKALTHKRFNNYWLDTGTSGSLFNFMKYKSIQDFEFEEISVMWDDLYSVDLNVLTAEVLLFRNGYLTIKEIKEYQGEIIECILRWPNYEVKKSVPKLALETVKGLNLAKVKNLRQVFLTSLENVDIELFNRGLLSLLSLLSCELAPEKEAAFHALLLYSFGFMGLDVMSEISTNRGRVDLVIYYKKTAFIIEIKYVEKEREIETGLKEAFKQIYDRKYYENFEVECDKVVLVGLVIANRGKTAKAEFEIKT